MILGVRLDFQLVVCPLIGHHGATLLVFTLTIKKTCHFPTETGIGYSFSINIGRTHLRFNFRPRFPNGWSITTRPMEPIEKDGNMRLIILLVTTHIKDHSITLGASAGSANVGTLVLDHGFSLVSLNYWTFQCRFVWFLKMKRVDTYMRFCFYPGRSQRTS